MTEPGAMRSVIETAKVVVCVGPGGVGKTSTSAAIGIEAARAGRRVAVLTIDPARRLANALGLPEIGNDERVIDGEAFRAAGLEVPEGRMSAMMLDIKQTWDEVIERYHPDPEAKAALLSNKFYRTLSTALAGSQEYMAMEKLHELSTRKDDPLDLIVLDTPPSESAVEFLEAPNRMLNALDNDATRWLMEPYEARRKVTQRLFDAGSTFFIRTIGRFTGIEVLQALAELLSGFSGMYRGFRDRARAVGEILGDDGTTFLVVGAPRPGPIADVRGFHERLVAESIRVGGVVLNRATRDPFVDGAPDPTALVSAVEAHGGSRALADSIIAEARRVHDTSQGELSDARVLAAEVGDIPVVCLPELEGEVSDLTSLDALRGYLFSAARVPFGDLTR